MSSFGKPQLPLLSHAAGYTNAGVIAAVSCVLAGLAQPSLLGMPYVGAAVAGIWQWARQQPSTPPRAVLLMGQVYTGEATQRVA